MPAHSRGGRGSCCGRLSLQIIEPLHLFGRCPGEEERRKHLSEGRVFPPPSHLHHVELKLLLGKLVRFKIMLQPASRVRSVKDEMSDLLGVAHGVRYRDRSSLRNAEECEPIEARGVHHSLEVAEPVGGFDQRRSLTDRSVRDRHAVRSGTKVNLLI